VSGKLVVTVLGSASIQFTDIITPTGGTYKLALDFGNSATIQFGQNAKGTVGGQIVYDSSKGLILTPRIEFSFKDQAAALDFKIKLESTINKGLWSPSLTVTFQV
jgi:hypothetical protein